MYIKTMIVENKNKYICIWLLLITFLVGLMILVGGLTRLTDSGLSITKWDLFQGILPPLTSFEWNNTFNLYKKIPEFQIVNQYMTLEEFKVIFWWEYTHRLLGRIIGLFYLLPLIFFTFKRSITKKIIVNLYFIFFLICIQGFLGWYMVRSGLVDRVDVSQYRLSLHLTLAFVILFFLFWNFLKFSNYNDYKGEKIPFNLSSIFFLFIILQISIGAFVSGLDAGKIYQTWPLMNNNYFPDDSSIYKLFSVQALETPSLVQFIHRNIAYVIFFIFLLIFFIILKNDKHSHLRKTAIYIFAFLLFQIFLGILTVLSGANIVLASLHQLGSILLSLSAIILVYKNLKTVS